MSEIKVVFKKGDHHDFNGLVEKYRKAYLQYLLPVFGELGGTYPCLELARYSGSHAIGAWRGIRLGKENHPGSPTLKVSIIPHAEGTPAAVTFVASLPPHRMSEELLEQVHTTLQPVAKQLNWQYAGVNYPMKENRRAVLLKYVTQAVTQLIENNPERMIAISELKRQLKNRFGASEREAEAVLATSEVECLIRLSRNAQGEIQGVGAPYLLDVLGRVNPEMREKFLANREVAITQNGHQPAPLQPAPEPLPPAIENCLDRVQELVQLIQKELQKLSERRQALLAGNEVRTLELEERQRQLRDWSQKSEEMEGEYQRRLQELINWREEKERALDEEGKRLKIPSSYEAEYAQLETEYVAQEERVLQLEKELLEVSSWLKSAKELLVEPVTV